MLRVFDPLGVYVGKLKPDARRWSIARRMSKKLDPTLVARQLSATQIRKFQSAAGLLDFIFRCAPKKYEAVVRQLDWAKLDAEIGNDWADPSHETEVLLGLLSLHEATRAIVADFIAARADRIQELPPRLVLLAPEAGIAHVAAGKRLRLARFGHLEWDMGALALYIIGESRPDLVEAAARPFIGNIAKSLESYNRNFAGEAEPLIRVLIDKAPSVWAEVLSTLDVDVSEKSLVDCLGKGGSHQRAAALVIESALQMEGPIREMAHRLRKRFPKGSIPPTASPLYVSRRRRRSRRTKK